MCKLCKERGKTWKGEDPTCGFSSGVFGDNWNCATVNAVRDICGDGEDSPRGIDYQYCDDRKYATIKIDHLDLTGRPLALWLSWYKNRGSTDEMWLLFSNSPPRKPTEAECLAVIAAYTR